MELKRLVSERLVKACLIIVLGLVPMVLTLPAVQSATTWNWNLTYNFDRSSYEPGASGTVSFSLTNTGSVSLQIREVGLQFDWQQAANHWWSQQVTATVDAGQSANLATVKFTVPAGTSEGTHKFRMGVYQSHLESYYDIYSGYYASWVDDGLQWGSGSFDFTISQPKPVLNFVSVTTVPPLGNPAYVGQMSTTVVIVTNTGDAKAPAVKAVLEELSPSTGLTVTNPDPMDIDPGGTGQWKIDIQTALPGNYAGKLRIYSGSTQVLEQDWQLQVLAPTISIAAKDTAPQGQLYAGDTITVTYTLSNASPVDATAITFDVKTSDGLTVLEEPTVAQIPSQSQATATLKLRADKTGTGSVQVTIMAYGTVAQQDKFNLNVAERPLWQQSWFLPLVAALVVMGLLAGILLARRRRAPKAPALVTSLPEQKTTAGPQMTCPRCGKALTYVQARSKNYCTRCKEYY